MLIPRLSFLALPVLALAPAAQTTRYTITDVSGALDGDAIGEAGLSDTGFVCGWLSATGNSGFRWSPDGGRAELLASGDLAWADSNSVGVNDAGAVVGLFGTTTGGLSLTRGYRWSNGVPKELLTPLGFRGMPEAINDAGWIVGHAGVRPLGTPGAVVWSPDLTPMFVADLDSALDINARGEIAGYRKVGSVFQGFVYSAGSLTPLGTLDPRRLGDVFPRAIDGLGNVVGTSDIQGVDHAFRWTPSTGMSELASLPGHSPQVDAAPLDSNDAGWIVGYTPDAQGLTNVIWAPDGSVHELEPFVPDIGPGQRWQQLFLALRINASGEIAASALRGGRLHFVLLTPATLQASALAPGVAGVPNTLALSGATPGLKTFLVGDFDDPLDRGYRRLPRARGLGLAMGKPNFVALALADAAGQATFRWTPPQTLAGVAIRLQAFQVGVPAVSNVVRVAL